MPDGTLSSRRVVPHPSSPWTSFQKCHDSVRESTIWAETWSSSRRIGSNNHLNQFKPLITNTKQPKHIKTYKTLKNLKISLKRQTGKLFGKVRATATAGLINIARLLQAALRFPNPGTLLIRPGPQLRQICQSCTKWSNERFYGTGDNFEVIKFGTGEGGRSR